MRAKLVNEGLLSDVKMEEILTKDFRNNLLAGDYEIQSMVFQQCKENYIECDIDDEEEVEKVLNTEDFKEYMKYEAEYKFDEVINMISDQIKNDNIEIFRIITVGKNWIKHLEKQGNHLGIYWSFDEDTAEPHWGYNNPEKQINALIKSSINQKYVDWFKTIRANLSLSTGEEEKEITLFKSTPLKISGISINGEEQDISKIKNKIFKA